MQKIEFKDYPDTRTLINSENLNTIQDNVEISINEVDTVLNSGWIPTNETWTYASVDNPTGVITISGDKTSKYSLGMRIKFTNATNVIYGIITKISYSSPNTTLTFLHEINPSNSLALHLMANSAITDNYYSNMKVPYGFPMNPDKWSVSMTDNRDVSQLSVASFTWYNLGGLFLDIPIGLWNVKTIFYGQIGIGSDPVGERYFQSALSTSNNSVSNTMFQGGVAGFGSFVRSMMTKENIVNLTSKIRHYCIARTLSPGGGLNIYFVGTEVPTIVKAVCAYL